MLKKCNWKRNDGYVCADVHCQHTGTSKDSRKCPYYRNGCPGDKNFENVNIFLRKQKKKMKLLKLLEVL